MKEPKSRRPDAPKSQRAALLNFLTLMTVLCGMLVLAFPKTAYSVTAMSVQFEDSLRLISLDMPHKEVIETLGTPDIIKSEGMCLQYEFLGLSVFLNQYDRVEQIYLSRDFQGTVGNKQLAGGIYLSDIENEFGRHESVDNLNYQPSPIIQAKAATETENKTDPTGKQKEEFPLQFPGNKKLYTFYNAGKIIKYKYVLDEEGIAFWLDHNQKLYATALYLSLDENASVRAPRTSMGKDTAATEKNLLAMVHFDFDKQNIKKIYIPVLDQQVAYLTECPSLPVSVKGHTDYMGSDEYNQKLSERRANAVRDYLIQKGIASSRIQTVGYSEHCPIADNKTAGGRAMNRRSELEVTLEK
jgi:outer membrane protein OmpA-like peptidoglycan-associated protein